MNSPRRILALLLLAEAGTGAELLLLEHTEDYWQQLPIVLLAAGCLALAWNALAPGRTSARALWAVMALTALSGLAGLYLHYQGNVEFELEMYESLAGRELFWKAMTGATPVLAPGALTVTGLFGLLYAGDRARERQRGK